MYYLTIAKKSSKAQAVRIAVLKGGGARYDGKFVWLWTDGDDDNGDHSKSPPIEFPKDLGVEVFPFYEHPANEKQVFHVHVIGQSGSGKSYHVGQALDQLITQKPKLTKIERAVVEYTGEDNIVRGNVVIFSGSPEDEPIDRERNDRVPFRMDLHDEELFDLTLKDLQDTICVWDDIDGISWSKKVRDFLIKLRGEITENGRHYNIDSFNISHNPMLGHVTRSLNQETSASVIFPRHNNTKKLDNYLDTYVDMSKEQIARLKALPGRFVYIRKRYPKYIIYERGVYLL